MFQNAKFYLSNKAPIYLDTTRNANLQCQIIPLTADEGNSKSCRNLEDRLSERLNRSEWVLDIELVLDLKVLTPELAVCKIIVRGKLLEQLHSLLLYNEGTARLKMKVSASVTSRVTNLMGPLPLTVTTIDSDFETELLPSATKEGSYDHSKYRSDSIVSHPTMAPKISLAGHTRNSLDFDLYFRESKFRLWIEGTVYDLNMWNGKHSSPIFNSQRRLLASGMGSDLKILVQDKLELPCHESVLLGQSSVLESMLQEKSFIEGKTQKISMEGRTKEEVMAFLTFLYCGDLSKALDNPTLGVTLYEMGHYYDVKGLESAIKTVLVSTPADLFEVDAALQLLNIAYGTGDLELKRKAADILEMKTNEDICASSLYNELAAPVVRELFVMSRRK